MNPASNSSATSAIEITNLSRRFDSKLALDQIALAVPREHGGMQIYTSTQHPGEVQHMVAHALAIHGTSGDESLAEPLLDVRQRRAALGGELVRDHVGVDHGGAEPGELVCGCAFAAADPAGKTYYEHQTLCRYQRSVISAEDTSAQ